LTVRISTPLATSADRAWETVLKPETLVYITRPLLGFRPLGHLPERLGEGQAVRVRLIFFNILPAWEHEIRIVRLDGVAREIYTNERGGPIRTWNHLIKIEPTSAERCRYTDQINISAGSLTPLIWLYAQLFYRYRQMRWRKLARSLQAQS
jgi:hypothetical protein